MTEAGEARETSCSPLRPPKRTPTRNLFLSFAMRTRGANCAAAGSQSTVHSLPLKGQAPGSCTERCVQVGKCPLTGAEDKKCKRFALGGETRGIPVLLRMCGKQRTLSPMKME